MTRQELIDYCLTLSDAYEDYPFDKIVNTNSTTVMRHRTNKKTFALMLIHDDLLYLNLKCNPDEADFLRQMYVGVIPGYHMNKQHWNTIIIGSDVPDEEIRRQIQNSYELTKPKVRKNKNEFNIFKEFRNAANSERAVPMQAYMRDQFEFLGIPTPERKKLSRSFLKEQTKKPVDWNFVFECWQQPEREIQYLAMDYLRIIQKTLKPEDIPNLRALVIKKSWWDTVDCLDTIIGDIALRNPEVNDTLLEWSVDENIWLRRLAIDHQLTRGEQTDTNLLTQIIINNFGQTVFFINKSIGWSLREYSKVNPDWVRNFITQHQESMASISIREASKHLK